MALALSAFSANAAAAAEKRERDRAAVSWYAERLQARAFAALAEAVLRRRELEVRLAAVAQSLQQTTVQEAFSGWRAQAALSTSESQLVAAARRRFARGRLQSCLAAWRSQVEQEQEQRRRLAGCMQRLSQMRLSWAFEVWRHQAAEAAAERRLVAWGQRCVVEAGLHVLASSIFLYCQWPFTSVAVWCLNSVCKHADPACLLMLNSADALPASGWRQPSLAGSSTPQTLLLRASRLSSWVLPKMERCCRTALSAGRHGPLAMRSSRWP